MNKQKTLTPEEDLINIIKKHIPNGCINLKSYGQELEMISKCMREYNRGKTEAQQWISVDEELPEEGVYVLVIQKTGMRDIARYIDSISDRARFDNPDWFGPSYDVTHWVPLPSAPTQGKEINEER